MKQKEKTKFEHFCDFLIRIAYFLIFNLLICLIIGTFLDLEFIPRNSQISSQSLIIVCLAFVFTLVLSKKYESINIFKILELKKSLKDSKNENFILEKKNSELLNHIVSISNTHIQSQSQGVINVNGSNIEALKHLLGVEQISKEEKEKKEKEEDVIAEEVSKHREEYSRKMRKRRQIEASVVDLAMKNQPYSMKDIKFNSFLDEVMDPIAKDLRAVFDGYYRTYTEEEVFIEVMWNTLSPMMRFDRLYHMLNKIYLYRQIKKTNVYLRLILLNIEDEEKEKTINMYNQLAQYFDRSIKNNLLQIEIFGINESGIQQKLSINNNQE